MLKLKHLKQPVSLQTETNNGRVKTGHRHQQKHLLGINKKLIRHQQKTDAHSYGGKEGRKERRKEGRTPPQPPR